MKNMVACILGLITVPVFAQTIEGTWQMTDSRTCFQSEMKESDTEKELEGMMGANSSNSVAKIIIFKKDGSGKEGIFSVGKKKGDDMNAFQYKINDNMLLFIDKKSGMATQRFVIDELSESSLKIHDAMKDCETKAFTKVK
ncbi:MAG: hypothetical protein JST48_13980 [Bacteroidetes bacterium]|nr:hypothetical protein [Bacteroidota bacterium]